MSMHHKRIFAGILCLFLLFSVLPQKVFAAGPIELDKSATLTIHYQHQNKPLSGTDFWLYRVADVSPSVQFTLTDAFTAYPVSLEELDSAGWKALAETLAGYTARDGITPIDRGTTDSDGLLYFPHEQTNMNAGLYLVIGQQSKEGQYIYTPEPFLICLPNRDADDSWDYDVTAEPKYDRQNQSESIDLKVLKSWNDKGQETQRPQEITIQLLRDGSVFDSVTLSTGNNWRHTWTALDGGHRWQVVEKSVPVGYTVSSSREGNTFLLTNTLRSTPGGKNPNTQNPDNPKLPQTGVLWWPVPLLALCGLLFFMIGWVRRRSYDE